VFFFFSKCDKSKCNLNDEGMRDDAKVETRGHGRQQWSEKTIDLKRLTMVEVY